MSNIIRVSKDTNYLVINKTSLQDKRLTWKAKGLHAFMLSKPNDWKFYDTELRKHAKDGIDSLKSAMKELKDNGYMKRVRKRNSEGKFEWETVVYEVPYVEKPSMDKPLVEKPLMDKPSMENPQLLSNEELSIDELNNDELNNDIPNKEVIPYVEIVNYLNNAASTNYRPQTQRTKKLIKARWNEGFRLDDFKTVINKKTNDWLNDSEMNKYIRPETLFGSKFESYLNQKGGVKENASTRQHTDISKYNFDKERNLSF